MKKNIFIWIAVLLLLAESVVIGQNLSYHYEPQGQENAVLANYLTDISGYEYGEDNYFIQTEQDPNFYLEGMGELCGGIKIVLKEPAQENIPVQVFYAEYKENGLSERHSVKNNIPAGEKECYLKLPLKNYQLLRFDLDASFSLEEIYSYDQEMKKTPVVTAETVQRAVKYLPVFLVFFCLLFYAHATQKKQMTLKEYAISIFTGIPKKNRSIEIDYLRVFAAVMIIISHSVSNEMASTAERSLPRFLFVAILTLGVCCNVMYVMISGHLLLSGSAKEIKISEFYCRRVSKVVIPLVAYYLFLLYLNHEISFFPPKNLGYALKSMLTGAPAVAPHFWLLYTFVALYLVTPILKAAVNHLTDRALLSLSLIILFMNALTTYLPLAGILFGVSTFLAGWEGVFILGYIIQKDSFRVHDRKMMLAAVISYVVSLGIVFTNYGTMNYIYVCAPPTVITTCGIFAFVRSHIKWFSKDGFILRMCSKYSFSILMIHWYTLFAVTEGRFHLSVMRGKIIGGLVATNVIAFFTSLVFVIVFDNTIVLIANVLFDQFIAQLSKMKK